MINTTHVHSENTDCKLDFDHPSVLLLVSSSIMTSSINITSAFVIFSFIFLQTIVHLPLFLQTTVRLIFLQTIVHLIIPSNYSPSCHSDFLSCSLFSQLYLRKCFNLVTWFCSRRLNNNVEIRRFCIGWLPHVYQSSNCLK